MFITILFVSYASIVNTFQRDFSPFLRFSLQRFNTIRVILPNLFGNSMKMSCELNSSSFIIMRIFLNWQFYIQFECTTNAQGRSKSSHFKFQCKETRDEKPNAKLLAMCNRPYLSGSRGKNKYEKCKFNAHHQINDNAKSWIYRVTSNKRKIEFSILKWRSLSVCLYLRACVCVCECQCQFEYKQWHLSPILSLLH